MSYRILSSLELLPRVESRKTISVRRGKDINDHYGPHILFSIFSSRPLVISLYPLRLSLILSLSTPGNASPLPPLLGGHHRRASLDIPKLCIHCVHLEAKQEKLLRQAILASTSSLANSIYPDIEISPPPIEDSDYCSNSPFVVSEEQKEEEEREEEEEDDDDDDDEEDGEEDEEEDDEDDDDREDDSEYSGE